MELHREISKGCEEEEFQGLLLYGGNGLLEKEAILKVVYLDLQCKEIIYKIQPLS